MKNIVDFQSLPAIWRGAPPRYGNTLHAMCSYMAMFPPALPRVFIEWLSSPGDVVYDPFSGRGTTTLEACLLGRIGLGADENPLAWILTAAKADPPTQVEIEHRILELKDACRSVDASSVPETIQRLFDARTLGQLLWLRRTLSPCRRVDRFILAVLLGGLHANADSSGCPRGLTVAMPNTFSMAPGYVDRYIKKHQLRPPRVNVVEFLRTRTQRFQPPGSGFCRGRAWRQDARKRARWPKGLELAKLIFSSPPYLAVMRYAQYNWIRHWLIGTQPREVDARLFSSSSLDKYVEFMRAAFTRMREVLRDDGFICVVIGDVRRPDHETLLGEIVAERCIQGLDLRIAGIVVDRLPIERKVSRIWGKTKGRATRTDRILILAAPKATVPNWVPSISWSGSAVRGGA